MHRTGAADDPPDALDDTGAGGAHPLLTGSQPVLDELNGNVSRFAHPISGKDDDVLVGDQGAFVLGDGGVADASPRARNDAMRAHASVRHLADGDGRDTARPDARDLVRRVERQR